MDLTTRWLLVQRRVLELIEERGTSRSKVGEALDKSKNLVARTFREDPEEAKQVAPNFELASEIFEHFEIDTSPYFDWLPDPAEAFLILLPICGRGKDERATRKHRTTKAQRQTRKLLATARSFELPEETPELSRPWPERQSKDPELVPVYEELDELERRRHHEDDVVQEICRKKIVRTPSMSLSVAEAVRVIGTLGMWGSIRRRNAYFRPARDALYLSLKLARQLGDKSLLAQQLQRSAYAFRDLGQPEVAVAVLDQAARHFRGEHNDVGAAKILVDYGVMAFHRDDLRRAESFYRGALKALPKSGHSVSRAAASQGVATCLEMMGNVPGALDFLQQSAEVGDSRDPRLCVALQHTAANIERRAKRYAEAEAKYWTALGFYSEHDEADPVLRVSLDLSTCLTLSGRWERLAKVRQVIHKHLPQVQNRNALRHHADLILAELALGKFASAERLQEIATTFR